MKNEERPETLKRSPAKAQRTLGATLDGAIEQCSDGIAGRSRTNERERALAKAQ